MPPDMSAGEGAGPPGDPPDADPADDLVFAAHDLRREPGGLVISQPPAAAPLAAERALAPRPGFRVTSHSSAPAADASTELPWTVRDAGPTPAAADRGWTSRQSELMDRSAADIASRLREDAVDTCWKAASIAVTAADRRLFKSRDW